jgi:hypothetical protein
MGTVGPPLCFANRRRSTGGAIGIYSRPLVDGTALFVCPQRGVNTAKRAIGKSADQCAVTPIDMATDCPGSTGRSRQKGKRLNNSDPAVLGLRR